MAIWRLWVCLCLVVVVFVLPLHLPLVWGGSESSLDYPLHYHSEPEPGEEKGSLYRG